MTADGPIPPTDPSAPPGYELGRRLREPGGRAEGFVATTVPEGHPSRPSSWFDEKLVDLGEAGGAEAAHEWTDEPAGDRPAVLSQLDRRSTGGLSVLVLGVGRAGRRRSSLDRSKETAPRRPVRPTAKS